MPTAAADVPVLSSILRSVVVHRQGAVCERIAAVTEVGDARTLRVVGLPLALVAGSLRARVTGGGDDLRVVDVRPAFEVELGGEVDLAIEQRELESAEHDCAALEDAMARVVAEQGELLALTPRFREPPRREPPRAAPLDAMLTLASFIDEQVEGLHARRRELSRALVDAQERVRLARHRIAEASAATRTERSRVTRAAWVMLSGAPPVGSALAIEYRVPGARWVPSYQLTLDEQGGAQLVMRAAIAQATGEDWSAVALSLSTASLVRRTEVPKLTALRIGRRQPSPPRAGWREPPAGLEGLFADFDAFEAHTRRRLRAVPPRGSTSAKAPASADARANLPGAPPPPPAPARPMMAPQMPAPIAASPATLAASVPMPQAASFGGMRQELRRAESIAAPKGRASIGGGGVEREAADDAIAHDGVSPSEPSAIAPSAGLLDYGAVRMAGLDDGQRGRLIPAPPLSQALARSGARATDPDPDALTRRVATAERAALEVATLPLPNASVAVDATFGFDHRYDARAAVDVPATGAWVTVPVTACDVRLRPRFVCVPAVEPQVYRTLELDNQSSRALLPGPVDVVRGGQFVLATSLPAIAPGSSGKRLGLGVEEGIKVARNTRYEETTGGIFRGAALLLHTVEVEVGNRLATPIELDVLERVPVAADGEKDLVVEEQEITPAWQVLDATHDGEQIAGRRRWRVTVPAGTSATLVAKYTIRMPADRMLVGGNRRT